MSTHIVVGSGPSGLAAAFRLHEAGHRVRILEAADRVGGKMRTTTRDGYLMDQGAFFLPTTHRLILEIADRAGFADQVVPGGFVLATKRDEDIHHLDGNSLVRDFVRTGLFSKRAKLAAAKIAPEVRRSKRATYDRMPECAEFDTETIDQWAYRTLHPEVAEFLVSTMMRALFAASPDRLSRVEFLGILSFFAGAKLVAFRGGMGQFAETLAGRFDVTTGATVVAVEETADSVRVIWRDAAGAEHVEEAEGCVLATAGAVTRKVHTGLDQWRRDYLGRVRHGQSWSMNVALSRPPAGIEAVYIQVPKGVSPVVAGVAFDHLKAPGRTPAGKGLLCLAILSEWCDEHADDPDDLVEKEVLGALEDVLPGVGSDIEFTVLNRWRQEFMPVGHYRDLGRFRDLYSTDRRIQLAGDHHSAPNLNSAAIAGGRAAERLLDRLGR